MDGVNKIILVGNAGADASSRNLTSGGTVTNVRLGVNKSWTNQNNQQRETRTEWFNLTFWHKLSEIAAKYIRKGTAIYVEGEVQTKTWDKDGVTQYRQEVNVRELRLLPSSNNNGTQQSQPSQAAPAASTSSQRTSTAPTQQSPSDDRSVFDDDIPW